MIVIDRRVIKVVLFILLLLLMAAYLIGPRVGITALFKLDQQGTVAVWYETVLYFLAAILLLLTALSRRAGGDKASWRWGFFALLILFLSLSAEAEINKKIVEKLTGWVWWFGWGLVELLVFAILAGLLLWTLWPVLAGMPRRSRRRFFLAGVVFVCGALVVDNLTDLLFRGGNGGMYLLEEGLEFSGLVLLIDATLAYLALEGAGMVIQVLPREED